MTQEFISKVPGAATNAPTGADIINQNFTELYNRAVSPVTPGGTAGQYLAKNSSIDGDASWFGPALTVTPTATVTVDTSVPGQAKLNVQTPGIIPAAVWASRATGTFDGQLCRISDIGAAPGTVMQWDNTGGFWKLLGITTVYANFTQTNGTATTPNQIVKQTSLPAGLLRCCRSVRVRMMFGKSGTTDAITNMRIIVGTAGTTGDTIFGQGSMIAGNRSTGTMIEFFPASTTSIVQSGISLSETGGFVLTASSSPPQTTTATVSNTDTNPLYISGMVGMAGTTDTPAVWDFVIDLIP